MVFVIAYNDGVIPERLQGRVAKGRALAQLIVVSPADDGKENVIHECG